MQHAANGLTNQARTLGARHLKEGAAQLRFGREVAYYARRIADDVALGKITSEQGLQALVQEQRDLLNQSRSLTRDNQRAITKAIKRMPSRRLTRPLMQRDPMRLLRFVHEQELQALDQSVSNTMIAAQPPAPRDTYKLFGSDKYPAPVPLHQPGFYLVPKSTTAQELEAQLFSSPASTVIAKYRALNPGLDQVKAGQLMVLSDPNNPRCTREEALLMAAASKVNKALEPLTPEEADSWPGTDPKSKPSLNTAPRRLVLASRYSAVR